MFTLLVRGLAYHWRSHAGAVVGAALAAAMLTGALLVGDSVDYSLRRYALARLGDIRVAVEARGGSFSSELATVVDEKLAENLVPVLRLPGMALPESGAQGRQVNQVNVIGVPGTFWRFGGGHAIELGEYETALNERLARALGVKTGDQVALRISKPGLLARDAPLSSRKEDVSTRVLCTIKAIVPDSGIGRFSLSASQTAPYNAFAGIEWLGRTSGLPGKANLMLAGLRVDADQLKQELANAWRLEDVGLRLRKHGGVIQLESDHIYLQPAVAKAALGLDQAQGTLAYLVNSISKGAKSTPYSFAVAGPVSEDLAENEAVINRWLADHVGAGRGDEIAVAYYELGPGNEFIEKTRAFTVHSVVEMNALEDERALMPAFPGLSDVENCADWDIGMPMDEEKLKDKANEDYWNAYRQTPKLLVTLAAGQAMWGNRFGDLMTVRFPESDTSEGAVRSALHEAVAPAQLGLIEIPVREQALDAVSQAIDLGSLFLGMSFFLIVSALILAALMFVFAVEQRASEMGTLLALGFRPRQVRALFIGEAVCLAILGALIGVVSGVAYTRLLIFALGRLWQGAVAGTGILYHAAPGTLAVAAVASSLCALTAMTLALWRLTRHTARELLMRDFSQDLPGKRTRRAGWLGLALPALGTVLALAMIGFVLVVGARDVSGAFFGSGAFLLISGIGGCRWLLQCAATGWVGGRFSLAGLSLENASRRRGRSLSVVALLATGVFLVLAVSSMQEDVTAGADKRSSGTGGFELYAETTLPLSNNPAASLDFEGVQAVAFRVNDGDDASCLNLNHAQTPRLLGANVEELKQLGAFIPEDYGKPVWALLDETLSGGAIPGLVGDSDTAMWGLKKKTGPQDGGVLVYHDESGNEAAIKLVGTLPRRLTVFQGSVLISNKAFTRLYPSRGGFQIFLIDTPEDRVDAVRKELVAKFGREGLDAVPAVERLKRFYTVESTYLRMFLVLGGLGVVLGSAALGVVVLRNLLERRKELAMLQAVGFSKQAIARLLLGEYGLLLVMGAGIGTVSAAVAMVPTVTASGADVPLGLQVFILALVVLAGCLCAGLAIGVGLARSTIDDLRFE